MSRTRKTAELKHAYYALPNREMFNQDHDFIVGNSPSDERERKTMRVTAYNANYTLYLGLDYFISFKKELLSPRTYRHGDLVFTNDHILGRWGTVEIDRVGPVTLVVLPHISDEMETKLEELMGERPEDHLVLYSYINAGAVHVKSYSDDNRVRVLSGEDRMDALGLIETNIAVKLLPIRK